MRVKNALQEQKLLLNAQKNVHAAQKVFLVIMKKLLNVNVVQ